MNADIEEMRYDAKDEEIIGKYIGLIHQYCNKTDIDDFDISSIDFGWINGYSRTHSKERFTNIKEAFENASNDDDCKGIVYNFKKGYFTLRRGIEIINDYSHLKKKTEDRFFEVSILKNDLEKIPIKRPKKNCNCCGKLRVIKECVVELRRSFRDRTKKDKPFLTEVKLCNSCYKKKVKGKEEIAKEEIDPEFISEYEGSKKSEGVLIGIEAPIFEEEEEEEEIVLPKINIIDCEFKKVGKILIAKNNLVETFDFSG